MLPIPITVTAGRSLRSVMVQLHLSWWITIVKDEVDLRSRRLLSS